MDGNRLSSNRDSQPTKIESTNAGAAITHGNTDSGLVTNNGTISHLVFANIISKNE